MYTKLWVTVAVLALIDSSLTLKINVGRPEEGKHFDKEAGLEPPVNSFEEELFEDGSGEKRECKIPRVETCCIQQLEKLDGSEKPGKGIRSISPSGNFSVTPNSSEARKREFSTASVIPLKGGNISQKLVKNRLRDELPYENEKKTPENKKNIILKKEAIGKSDDNLSVRSILLIQKNINGSNSGSLNKFKNASLEGFIQTTRKIEILNDLLLKSKSSKEYPKMRNSEKWLNMDLMNEKEKKLGGRFGKLMITSTNPRLNTKPVAHFEKNVQTGPNVSTNDDFESIPHNGSKTLVSRLVLPNKEILTLYCPNETGMVTIFNFTNLTVITKSKESEKYCYEKGEKSPEVNVITQLNDFSEYDLQTEKVSATLSEPMFSCKLYEKEMGIERSKEITTNSFSRQFYILNTFLPMSNDLTSGEFSVTLGTNTLSSLEKIILGNDQVTELSSGLLAKTEGLSLPNAQSEMCTDELNERKHWDGNASSLADNKNYLLNGQNVSENGTVSSDKIGKEKMKLLTFLSYSGFSTSTPKTRLNWDEEEKDITTMCNELVDGDCLTTTDLTSSSVEYESSDEGLISDVREGRKRTKSLETRSKISNNVKKSNSIQTKKIISKGIRSNNCTKMKLDTNILPNTSKNLKNTSRILTNRNMTHAILDAILLSNLPQNSPKINLINQYFHTLGRTEKYSSSLSESFSQPIMCNSRRKKIKVNECKVINKNDKKDDNKFNEECKKAILPLPDEFEIFPRIKPTFKTVSLTGDFTTESIGEDDYNTGIHFHGPEAKYIEEPKIPLEEKRKNDLFNKTVGQETHPQAASFGRNAVMELAKTLGENYTIVAIPKKSVQALSKVPYLALFDEHLIKNSKLNQLRAGNVDVGGISEILNRNRGLTNMKFFSSIQQSLKKNDKDGNETRVGIESLPLSNDKASLEKGKTERKASLSEDEASLKREGRLREIIRERLLVGRNRTRKKLGFQNSAFYPSDSNTLLSMDENSNDNSICRMSGEVEIGEREGSKKTMLQQENPGETIGSREVETRLRGSIKLNNDELTKDFDSLEIEPFKKALSAVSEELSRRSKVFSKPFNEASKTPLSIVSSNISSNKPSPLKENPENEPSQLLGLLSPTEKNNGPVELKELSGGTNE